MTRSRRLAAALAALSLTVLTACSGSSDDGMLQIGPDGTISRWEQGMGPELPALKGTTLEGTTLDVASWKGDVVVLNVWGTWCGPCQSEAPTLAQVASTASKDVHFVGIDVEDHGDRAKALAFQSNYSLDYPSLDDQDGKHALALRALLIGNKQPPQTLVVGADGRVTGRIVGVVQASILRGLIEDAGAANGGSSAVPSPGSS